MNNTEKTIGNNNGRPYRVSEENGQIFLDGKPVKGRALGPPILLPLSENNGGIDGIVSKFMPEGANAYGLVNGHTPYSSSDFTLWELLLYFRRCHLLPTDPVQKVQCYQLEIQ